MSLPNPTDPTTELLSRSANGDKEAFGLVYARLYETLTRMGRGILRRSEHPTGDPGTCTVVHEAYLKLVGGARLPHANDRNHFYSIAAKAMRAVIVDHVRRALAQKRGGGAIHVPLRTEDAVEDSSLNEIVAVHDTLRRLADHSEELVRVVELRFFAALEWSDVAGVLGVSESTARRRWKAARGWILEIWESDDGLERLR